MRKALTGIVILVLLAGVRALSAGGEREAVLMDDDERLLEAAGLSSEGPGLLELFRARARTELEPGRVDELVRRLSGPSHGERIQAGADLVALGPLAVPGLRRMANDIGEPDVQDWARRCLAWVDGPDKATLAMAAARLVAKRKPAGAAEVLLAYLPYADNVEVINEIGLALQAVAVGEDGKLDAALVKALTDPVALRRAIAGAALGQAAPGDNEAAEKLLKDPNPEVRMSAGLALAKAHNAAAIPVLIDLVAVLPPEKRGKVEEVLQELAGEWAPTGGPAGEDEIARKIRRDAWAGWWANTGGTSLINLLGKHTLTADEQAKVKDAIKRLADKTFAVREKAVVELVASGRRILPMLRDAIKDSELEAVKRLERCIQRIENEPANRLPSASIRLLALRRPAGAAEALIAYLPFAETDYVDSVRSALGVVAQRDGKPDPALLKALDAPREDVRIAAAEALAQGGGTEGRDAVRKFLTDDNLQLRRRVAMAMAPKDADAIPVLIALIPKARDEAAAQIHDFLQPLAGEKAPTPPQDGDKGRQKCSDDWAKWWEANSAKVDLARLTRIDDSARYGYTVIAEYGTGKVVELGRDRKPRWEFAGTASPVDAWVTSNNRVIVSEYGGNRVTCRDMKGNVIWTKQMNGQPFNVQVLPNGNVFIASNVQIAEVDRNGKDVNFNFKDANIQQVIQQISSLTGGYKTRQGQFILMGQNGQCLRLDANGKQLKSFNTGRNNAWLDVTPNGRIIMATNGGNKIAEYNAEGKMLLELDVQQVSMVTGLPNGHFLVASNSLGTVVEMDRRGKVVWEYRTNGPFRARGR